MSTLSDKLIAFGRAQGALPSGKVKTLAESLGCNPADASGVFDSLTSYGYLCYCRHGYPVMSPTGVRALARAKRRLGVAP